MHTEPRRRHGITVPTYLSIIKRGGGEPVIKPKTCLHWQQPVLQNTYFVGKKRGGGEKGGEVAAPTTPPAPRYVFFPRLTAPRHFLNYTLPGIIRNKEGWRTSNNSV